MSWMAWTTPTAIFFLCIAVGIITMTLAELRWPTQERRGWLPMSTTRGDRFFISLLSAAYVHLTWLAVSDAPVVLASLLSVILAGLIMRWG